MDSGAANVRRSLRRVLLSEHKMLRYRTLDLVKPLGLIIMLGGEDTGIEEHHDDHKPVECLRFHCLTARFPTPPVPFH